MVTSVDADLGSWSHWHDEDRPLRLGVSACLLGQNVRYDRGHARDRFLVETLGLWFEFVAVCPEVEVGMGVPRPSVRLVDRAGETRMVAPATGEDFTAPMAELTRRRVAELQELDLDGFVLKRGSPSCGLERIKVYREGMPSAKRRPGMFAEGLLEGWPDLPVEEEGRLNDPGLRENFIERAFARNRWRGLVAAGPSRRRLVAFHTAHKLLLRAHNEAGYRRLGRLVGGAGQGDDAGLLAAYGREFHRVLRTRASAKKHTNVLQHAMGHLKKHLSPLEKREILAAIDDFRRGLLPLILPLTLLRYNIRRHGIDYLAGQLYFDPHPKELMLRNHA